MATFRFNRLWAMARKEAMQLRRDKRSLILAFLLPVLLLVIFGYAISWDVKDISTAVLNQDNSAQSRELLDAFRASGYFSFRRNLVRTQEIEPLLDGVDTQLVLVIPPDFSADLNSGRPAEVQAIVDGSDANTATIILAYTRAITLSYSLEVQLQGPRVNLPMRVESRVWYNEELLSRNMIVPGLVAVIMMIVAAMLTSLTIAREWERGTMEQLAATPVSRHRGRARQAAALSRHRPDRRGVCALLGVWMFDVPFRGTCCAVHGAVDVLSDRRAGPRHCHFGAWPLPAGGNTGRDDRYVPAGVPAVGFHVFDFGDAAATADADLSHPGALFHRGHARYFPEGSRARRRSGPGAADGRVRGARSGLRDPGVPQGVALMRKASLERIREMVRKEFLQLFRDPRMWAIVFIAPLIQLVIFGYAVSTDIKETTTFVVDHSRTQESRDLVEALTASGYFKVIGQSQRPADVVRALDHEDALVGMVIPADFAERLARRAGRGRAAAA